MVIWPGGGGSAEDLTRCYYSSYRVEMLARASGLKHICQHQRDDDLSVICTNSMTHHRSYSELAMPHRHHRWESPSDKSWKQSPEQTISSPPSGSPATVASRGTSMPTSSPGMLQSFSNRPSRQMAGPSAERWPGRPREKTVKSWPPGWYRTMMEGQLAPRGRGIRPDGGGRRPAPSSRAVSSGRDIGGAPGPICTGSGATRRESA